MLLGNKLTDDLLLNCLETQWKPIPELQVPFMQEFRRGRNNPEIHNWKWLIAQARDLLEEERLQKQEAERIAFDRKNGATKTPTPATPALDGQQPEPKGKAKAKAKKEKDKEKDKDKDKDKDKEKKKASHEKLMKMQAELKAAKSALAAVQPDAKGKGKGKDKSKDKNKGKGKGKQGQTKSRESSPTGSVRSNASAGSTSAKPRDAAGKLICWHFAKGNCNRGDECSFSHEEAAS